MQLPVLTTEDRDSPGEGWYFPADAKSSLFEHSLKDADTVFLLALPVAHSLPSLGEQNPFQVASLPFLLSSWLPLGKASSRDSCCFLLPLLFHLFALSHNAPPVAVHK